MNKDDNVRLFLAALQRRFGDAVAVVDHWEGDRLAVGVARRGTEEPLAYVCARHHARGVRYYVALELPPSPGSDMPYVDAGERADLTLDKAVDLVARHLALS
jgi:hypothetical protein